MEVWFCPLRFSLRKADGDEMILNTAAMDVAREVLCFFFLSLISLPSSLKTKRVKACLDESPRQTCCKNEKRRACRA